MNRSISVTAVGLLLLLVSSAAAQRPPLDRKALIGDRTDLINDVQQGADAAAQRARNATADKAGKDYMKLKVMRERNPDSIWAEELSRYSLEWFKTQVAAAATRPDAMKVASEYWEREGEAVKP